jgi:protocatechuate 3,4-dioxygenase, beta subunit
MRSKGDEVRTKFEEPEMRMIPKRRAVTAAAAMVVAGGLLPRVATAARLEPTPRQTLGPFYPVDPPQQTVEDLIIERDGKRAGGDPVILTGRVLDTEGRPLAGALVEIWQCNAAGRYHHPRDRSPAPVDPLFRGYGRTVTATDGSYRFRTIRPVPYSGRTPHIHYQVSVDGDPKLVTQLYVRGFDGNERDFLFSRLSPSQRERVLTDFVAGNPGRASFDLVLAG